MKLADVDCWPELASVWLAHITVNNVEALAERVAAPVRIGQA